MSSKIHKPADHSTPEFHKAQWKVLFALITTYAGYYFVRQNFSIVVPVLEKDYGFTKTEFGIFFTLHYILYGFGKFINGYISDRSNARNFMIAGLLLSGFFSIISGLTTSLYVIGFMYVVNGWIQSMGFPPMASILTHWFSQKELGTKWAMASCSQQIGGGAVMLLGGYLVDHHGWNYVFVVPGIISVLIGLMCFHFLKDRPEEMGFSEHFDPEDRHFEDEDGRSKLNLKFFLRYISKNRAIWYICLANFFVYIVRIGVFSWAPSFLSEHRSTTIMSATTKVLAFDIAGIIGGLTAGYISDKLFHGRRGPVGFIYMALLAGAICLLWVPEHYGAYLDYITMFLIGFLVYAPQVLVGVASADFSSKKVIGTINGFVGIFGYLGGALAGVGTGALAQHYGWGGGFAFFILAAILGSFTFAFIWRNDNRKRLKQATLNTISGD